MVNFECIYKVKISCAMECEIRMDRGKMEEVQEFMYLSLILCKHGSMGNKTRERAVHAKRSQIHGLHEKGKVSEQ